MGFFLYIIYCVQVCYWCKQFLKGVKKTKIFYKNAQKYAQSKLKSATLCFM